VNRVQVGPNALAGLVLVFAGISFVAGLAVGTSRGADAPQTALGIESPTGTPPVPGATANRAERDDGELPWRAPAVAADSVPRETRPESLTDSAFFSGSALLDPAMFDDAERAPLPEAAGPRINRDALGLEDPLLPPR